MDNGRRSLYRTQNMENNNFELNFILFYTLSAFIVNFYLYFSHAYHTTEQSRTETAIDVDGIPYGKGISNGQCSL